MLGQVAEWIGEAEMVKATRGHTFWGSLPLYSLSVPGVFCDSSLHYGVPPALLGSPSKSLQCTLPEPGAGWVYGYGIGKMEFCFWFGRQTGQRKGPARVRPGSGCSGLLLSSSHRAVGQMVSTMFYPLVTFVLLVICIGYWAVTALYPSYSPHWRARGGRWGWGMGARNIIPTRGCEGTVL